MTKRLLTITLIAAVGLLVLLGASGCGDETSTVEIQTPEDIMDQISAGTTEDDLSKKIDELKKAEMTVEILENGVSSGKWSQDMEGSWRWDDPNDPSSYVIYNAQKKKTWVVTGNTALESSDTSQSSAYAGFNPAMIMSAFAFLPRTGGSDDVWELEMPGQGKLTIEFKGPDGLPSKMIDEDFQTGKKDTTEFKYSNIGDVPASTFELPGDVTVESYDSIMGTGTSMMPDGSGNSSDVMGGEDMMP